MKLSNRKKTYDPEFEQDLEFEKWINQQIMDETAEIAKEMDDNPNLDDFEPSEELYERIVKEARERGL